MQSLFKTWRLLLKQHQDLLNELEISLTSEKDALLANDILALRRAAIGKEKASRKLQQVQDEINQFKEKTVQKLELEEAPQTLQDLFAYFEPEEQEELLSSRRVLIRTSKSIDKINRFNHKCLETYRSYVDGVRSIFSDARLDSMQTYDAIGQKYNNDPQGRFLNRSL